MALMAGEPSSATPEFDCDDITLGMVMSAARFMIDLNTDYIYPVNC
jgi:hypothetical protein